MPGPNLLAIRPTPADTRDVIAHAHQACLAAAKAVGRATAVVESSRMLYAEREHWREVWNDLQDAEYLAVCCVYCHRIRTRDGIWGVIPSSMYDIIHEIGRMNLTHGICPDCLHVVLPTTKAAVDTAN
jgi:hypothetical protein